MGMNEVSQSFNQSVSLLRRQMYLPIHVFLPSWPPQ